MIYQGFFFIFTKFLLLKNQNGAGMGQDYKITAFLCLINSLAPLFEGFLFQSIFTFLIYLPKDFVVYCRNDSIKIFLKRRNYFEVKPK